MLMTFTVIQFVPGGPIEQVIAKMQGTDTDATARISGNSGNEAGGNEQSQLGVDSGIKYKGAQGLDPEFIKSLEKQFGFDKPVHERFLHDDQRLSDLQFRQELFQGPECGRPDDRENAGVDFAGPLADADHLSRFHSAWHPQGRA